MLLYVSPKISIIESIRFVHNQEVFARIMDGDHQAYHLIHL